MRKDLCRKKLKWGFDFSAHAHAVTLAQLIERRACDRKVAESRFDCQTGNTSIGVAGIFDWGGPNHKSHAMTSSEIFKKGSFCGAKIS